MKFDSPSAVLDIVWRMRLVERERSRNRDILNNHFNGKPPYDPAKAEENGIWVNRSFLTGPRILADARRQWNQAMMSDNNFFTATLFRGPIHKRDDWSAIATEEANRELRRGRRMVEQIRSTGAGVVLHGIGPSAWRDRYMPVPDVLPLASLLVPSETELDFDNLPYVGIYREFTPWQLHRLVSGPKVDLAWNRPLADQLVKSAMARPPGEMNANAIEYTAERVSEAMKQNGGFWNSDVCPTVKVWDFYYYGEEDPGTGVYRKIVLDTNEGCESTSPYRPAFIEKNKEAFLFDGKNRRYADSLSEVLHCQFGDCSAVPPFKYKSVRSLGWLIWGVTELEDRFECRFVESMFENMMWFFRVAGQNDFGRIKEAVFHHIGVIPQGVSFIPAQERFVPNPNIISQARDSFRQRIAETAASYTHDFDKGSGRTQLTATETMARVNSTNSLVQGMMTLAYQYEDTKDREIFRRLILKDNPRAEALRVRAACLRRGIPPKYLDDIEAWDVRHNRVIGAGNKTVQMAAIGFLQQIRKNLGPAGQQKVDHLAVSSLDKPGLADDLVPMNGKQISNSAHDAELSTDRLMRGLEFSTRDDMIAEDYVVTWLKDMSTMVERAIATNSGDIPFLTGLQNVYVHITKFLKQMEGDDENKPKVRVYSDALNQIMNHVKAIGQRLAEAQKAQAEAGAAGANGEAAGEAAAQAAKVQGQMQLNQLKQQHNREMHILKTSQVQTAFELDQQRKDRELEAELRRKQAQFEVDLQAKIRDAQLEHEREKMALEQAAMAAEQEMHHAEKKAEMETETASSEE